MCVLSKKLPDGEKSQNRAGSPFENSSCTVLCPAVFCLSLYERSARRTENIFILVEYRSILYCFLNGTSARSLEKVGFVFFLQYCFFRLLSFLFSKLFLCCSFAPPEFSDFLFSVEPPGCLRSLKCSWIPQTETMQTPRLTF